MPKIIKIYLQFVDQYGRALEVDPTLDHNA